MAPRRPEKKAKKRSGVSRAAGGDASEPAQTISPSVLLKAAEHHLSEGNAPDALILAKTAFDQQSASPDSEQDATLLLPSLSMLGQINLELGELADAKTCFLRAAEIDPEGSVPEALGGGAEKFLCLAQLSDEGGADSVGWFNRGAAALKAQIQKLEASSSTRSTTSAAAAAIRRKRNGDSSMAAVDEAELELRLLKTKLAMALCSVAEVYMTDLSWEADAEQQCESLVTEATMVAPDSAESWQTLANVRISQDRKDDAMAALTRSLELWKDLAPDDLLVPDFPSRVALARLLLEVEMETAAIEVLERLVGEDDHSVEVWYLGGWALYILGEKQRQKQEAAAAAAAAAAKTNHKGAVQTADEEEEDWKSSWTSSRVWLNQSQHLYKMQEYEDDRLGEHTKELLAGIAQELGEASEEEDDAAGDDDGEEGWEDDEEDSDDEMKG